MALFNVEQRRGRTIFISGLVGVVIALVGFYLFKNNQPQKTVITTDTIKDVGVGRIVSGRSQSMQPKVLSTNSDLQFESNELQIENPKTTAAVLQWSQTGGDEGVHVELRTYDGNNWSPWIETESGDGKDNAPRKHSAIIISKDIHRVQYRFNLKGNTETPSPSIDLNKASVETIDTSQGPSLDQKPLWKKIISSVRLDHGVSARMGRDVPNIYNRSDWGSPEPGGSPNWQPEYRKLTRAFVHHTATTATADSAAAIRAIWQYHTNTNGWGDIGYNYIVDQSGRVFQGRYFDQTYAELNNVDVVGGHVYGNNYGTTGIAALGDFTNVNPSGGLLNAIGHVSSYKLGAYNVNPADGTNFIGHKDVGQTACPGARLYPQLPTIRSVAGSVFPQYQIRPFTWQYDTQYAYTDQTKTTPVNLQNTARGQRVYVGVKARNVGTEIWRNSGGNVVKLGTSNPQDRSSKVCDNTWLSCNRPTALLESEVAVGEVGTFEFWYNVPASGGSFSEYFNLLAENSMWMNDLGLHFKTYAPPPTYTWQLINQYAYTNNSKTTQVNLTNLVPNQRVFIGFQAKNTGNVTWLNTGGNPTRVATNSPQNRNSAFCDPSWVSCSRPTNLIEGSVAPNQTGTFEFWYKAPSNPGDYQEGFRPLTEGLAWMNDTGLNFSTKVVHPALNTSDTDKLIINQQLLVNQTIVSKDGRYRLVMQSDGNLVLYSPNRPIWYTSTAGTPATNLTMQSDGHLVLYSNQGRPYWYSNTAGRGQSFLQLQNDGNLVLYDGLGRPAWFSGTHGQL